VRLSNINNENNSLGLQALKIFFKRHNLAVSEKYPSLWYSNRDSNADFNPNVNYLRNYDVDENPVESSPFFCFTLIPTQKHDGTDAMKASLYLLHFLNWAVYYYKRLHIAYSAIPKDPDKSSKVIALSNVKWMAEIMTDVTGVEYSEDVLSKQAQKIFEKNSFPIKPAYFLKLCRFFARAWFEEHFCPPDDPRGSVEFSYYIYKYLEASLSDKTATIQCYDGNGEFYKKELKRHSAEKGDIDITYDNFRIQLQRHHDCDGHAYTITISQYGCAHHFQLFARLFLHRLLPSLF
jgi:hypothetical protein